MKLALNHPFAEAAISLTESQNRMQACQLCRRNICRQRRCGDSNSGSRLLPTVSRWWLFNLLTWLRWHRSCARTSVDSTNDAAATTRFNCLTSPSLSLSLTQRRRRSVTRLWLYDLRRCRAHQQSSASVAQLLQPCTLSLNTTL